jgi:hypothetical protein
MQPNTGVAQRKRAGLITPRSLDRNESPVIKRHIIISQIYIIMIFTLLAKSAAYICYYSFYYGGRAVYSMFNDPALIALVVLL